MFLLDISRRRLLSAIEGKKQAKKPSRHRARPRIEGLEDRLTPVVNATYSGDVFLVAGADSNASQLNGDQDEVHIAVDRLNPGNVVVTSNGGTAPNEFTAFSQNAGATWTVNQIGNAAAAGNVGDGLGGGSRFDGAVATDRFGNIHVVYIARPIFP